MGSDHQYRLHYEKQSGPPREKPMNKPSLKNVSFRLLYAHQYGNDRLIPPGIIKETVYEKTQAIAWEVTTNIACIMRNNLARWGETP
jgi:hypothetical protein